MADDITGNAAGDLSSMLSQLMANKELMSKISEIAGSQPKKEPADVTVTETASIDSLISNPDIMAKLPDVISVIKPLMSNTNPERKKNSSFDKRMGLLMAMKPYLSPKRCEAIDYIARMSKLSETVKGLKLQ